MRIQCVSLAIRHTNSQCASSTGKAAGVEKGLLLRRHAAPQRRVAMGKPAEAANDAGMELGVCHEFIVTISERQLHASVLIRGSFRVHERQIEELALLLRYFLVEAPREGAIGDGEGNRLRVVG